MLITFCGLDAAGKSTNINALKKKMHGMYGGTTLLKQPTEEVRKSEMFKTYMAKSDHANYDYLALSLRCFSDRLQQDKWEVRPALDRGDAVICDRYIFSHLANLNAREMQDRIWAVDLSKNIVKPDIAFFLDVPVEVSVKRVRQRPEEKNKYIDIDLQYKLRDEYLKIAKLNDGIVIDCTQEPDRVFQRIMAEVLKKRALKQGVFLS